MKRESKSFIKKIKHQYRDRINISNREIKKQKLQNKIKSERPKTCLSEYFKNFNSLYKING